MAGGIVIAAALISLVALAVSITAFVQARRHARDVDARWHADDPGDEMQRRVAELRRIGAI